jgi:hypothetical protein
VEDIERSLLDKENINVNVNVAKKDKVTNGKVIS